MNPIYCIHRQWYHEETEQDRIIKKRAKTEDARNNTKTQKKADNKFFRGK
jgi:hypothetical protein